MEWYWIALGLSVGVGAGVSAATYLLDRYVIRDLGLGGWR
jgi:hypothetical protein